MIKTKKDLKEYMEADRKQLGVNILMKYGDMKFI